MISNAMFRIAGLGCVALLVALGLLMLWPPQSSLPRSFAVGTLHHQEDTPFLGAYHWTTPTGMLQIPVHWYTPHVMVRQMLSAGSEARPLTLDSPGGPIIFMLAAGQVRTYHYLMPVSSGWVTAAYQIEDVGPLTGDPRALGFIVQSSEVVYLAGPLFWPSPALIMLALTPSLLIGVVWVWSSGGWRWFFFLGLLGVLLLSYVADGVALLIVAPSLVLGLVWVGLLGWLYGKLCREGLTVWPNLVLGLSLGFTAVPLLLVLIGADGILPNAWPLLLVPFVMVLGSMLPASLPYRGILAMLAGACVLLWAGLYGYTDAFLRMPSDFQAYYDAAQRLRAGLPLYELDQLAANAFATTYKYPPLTALLLLPLSLLSLTAASNVWRLLLVGAAVGSMGMLHATHPPKRRRMLMLIALALLVLLSPISRSLRFGQPELLILLGAVIATYLFLRGYHWLSALLWALLGLVKIYPILLTLPLIIVGRRRWVLMLVVCTIGWSLLSLVVTGWDLIFWLELFPTLGARDGRLSNLALSGVLTRIIEPAAYRGNIAVSAAGLPVLISSGMLALATLGLLWQRRAALAQHIWLAFSLMICTVLLIIPVAWDHYHAMLLVPLIVSLGWLGDPGDHALLWFGAYSLIIFGVARDIWPTERALLDPLTMFLRSYRVIGLGLLWFWFVRQLAQAPNLTKAL
ncbi:glycosyltransferase family 87 protein [Candidatus Chloroploca sp. Khr17]|uniref:glycosyltransferase family 87 protein n=1 Tax=Candidatus Chloroploca sp. Khr17 TaxID=2496869 RepID=UPI00101C3816|nr:glycosyltransferase family 87 protein [Candidatus Chloroploca sp. Khr17]